LGVSVTDLSLSAQQVWKLPFLSRRLHSAIVTFHFNKLVQIKRKYSVAPTLVKSNSGSFMIRDLFGVRVLTGREVALIHGYSDVVIKAFESVASSNLIVEAIGDGLVINVMRDVLKAVLK